MAYLKSRYFIFVFLLFSSTVIPVHASVVMTGTRIIYNEDSRSVDVNLKNRSDFPYVVQTWFDNGIMTNGPDDSVAVPFIATPPVFRIPAGDGQVVKVTYTHSADLPKDRESVFYFNFLQVPPANITPADAKNKMLVMLRNRVKLFYRPTALSGLNNKKFPDISVSEEKKGTDVSIKNNTPFYISVSNITLADKKQKSISEPAMIPPFAKQLFAVNDGVSVKGKKIIVYVINDQGASLHAEYAIQ